MSQEKSWKHELLENAIIIGLVLAIVWGSGFGLQIYLQIPTPLLAVESESMEPILFRGDLVVVRAVNPATLQVGDIIIYDPASLRLPIGDVPIVHRIVEIQNISGELRFITKGDNNPGPDPHYRTVNDVIAKVIGSVRYLGFITLLLLSPMGLTSIIILVVVFFASSMLCESYAPRKKDKELETTDVLEKG